MSFVGFKWSGHPFLFHRLFLCEKNTFPRTNAMKQKQRVDHKPNPSKPLLKQKQEIQLFGLVVVFSSQRLQNQGKNNMKFKNNMRTQNHKREWNSSHPEHVEEDLLFIVYISVAQPERMTHTHRKDKTCFPLALHESKKLHDFTLRFCLPEKVLENRQGLISGLWGGTLKQNVKTGANRRPHLGSDMTTLFDFAWTTSWFRLLIVVSAT